MQVSSHVESISGGKGKDRGTRSSRARRAIVSQIDHSPAPTLKAENDFEDDGNFKPAEEC